MTVYLVDEPNLSIALEYASEDKEARLVLLQDAVYGASKAKIRGAVYAIDKDVARRGLGARIPASVKVIGYPELVQMMESEKVVNFL